MLEGELLSRWINKGKGEMDSARTVQKDSSYNQWVAPGVPFVLCYSEINEDERD